MMQGHNAHSKTTRAVSAPSRKIVITEAIQVRVDRIPNKVNRRIIRKTHRDGEEVTTVAKSEATPEARTSKIIRGLRTIVVVPTRRRKMTPVVAATGKTKVHLLTPLHRSPFLKTKTTGLTLIMPRSRELAETKTVTTHLKTAQKITIAISRRTRGVTPVVGKAIREAVKDSETHREAHLKRAVVLVPSPLLYPATTAPPTTDVAVEPRTIKRRNNLMATILATTTTSRRPSSRQARYKSRRRAKIRILHEKATMAVVTIEMTTTTPINQVSTRSQEPLSD